MEHKGKISVILKIISKLDPFRIFDFLFYSNYRAAENISYWSDTPVLFGTMWNMLPIIGFVGACICILDGFHITNIMILFHQDKFSAFGICYIAGNCIAPYIYYKMRIKSILRKYDNVKLNWWVSMFIYFIYGFVCGTLMIVAALFKNREWIFSGLD